MSARQQSCRSSCCHPTPGSDATLSSGVFHQSGHHETTAKVGEKLSGLRVKEDKEQALYNNSLVIDIWGKEVVDDFYASYPDVRCE